MKEGTCHSEFVPRATTSLSRISYKLGQEDTRIWNLLLCICDPFFIYRTSEKESRPRILLISTSRNALSLPLSIPGQIISFSAIDHQLQACISLCCSRTACFDTKFGRPRRRRRWRSALKLFTEISETRSLYISAFICDVPLAPWWLKIPSALSDKESNAAAAPACSSSGSRIVFMFPVFWFHSFLHLSNSGCVVE